MQIDLSTADTFSFSFENDAALADFVNAARPFVHPEIVSDLENGRSVFCMNTGRALARVALVCEGVSFRAE